MEVIFKSIDLEARKVTLSVDGEDVCRSIASNVDDVDGYIESLAKGLIIEKRGDAKALASPSFKADETILSEDSEGEM